MDSKQHALAAEIRAEAAAQRITAKDMQRAADISSSAYSNYFVKCTRDVPMSVVVAVAGALGMAGSELLRRAEAREQATAHPVTSELEAGLSQRNRDLVADFLPPAAPSAERPTRKNRSA